MNNFALDFNKKIPQKPNLFWSPYSVFSAMAMVTAGSKEQTHKELSVALKLSNSNEWEDVVRINHSINDSKSEAIKIEYANSIWAQTNEKWSSRYIDLCKEKFESEVKFTDYKTNTEGSRQNINNWVKDKTKEKIKNLLPQGSLNELTRMVLCNCIYFKGDWEDKFDKSATHNQTFWGSNKPSDVPMMHRYDDMFAYADENNSVVCLPYKDGKMQMNIFVPHKKDKNGIEALEEKFDEGYMNYMLDSCCSCKTKLTFPKFKIESTNQFKEVFQKCGVEQAFTPKATFSMYEEEYGNICIDEIFHKAFVEVNEEGSEAAAATAVVTLYCCTSFVKAKELKIEADHPFLFTITTGERDILFMGKVTQL